MTALDIHTTSDWMRTLATAMTARDEDILIALEQKTRDWLQPEDEAQAQQALLEAAWALIGDCPE
jgi:hypothetical protein